MKEKQPKSKVVTDKDLEIDHRNFLRIFQQLEAGETPTGPLTVGGLPVQFVDEKNGTVSQLGKKGWETHPDKNKGQKP